MTETASARTSLDLTGPPAGCRIVVAMSGGVDSSVAAALLKDQGYDVVGITLQLYDHGAAVRRPGACCAGADIADARSVAARLDIPHYVLDYESRFREAVVEDFIAGYVAGETPIPCVRCNQTVKFRDLLGVARELGAQALATGHYVQRLPGARSVARWSSGPCAPRHYVQRLPGAHGPELHRATDRARDQSYFLFATTPAQLAMLRFPLGGLAKAETRRLAERAGLPVAAKADSQDICFVPEGRYGQTIERLRPGAAEPGDIGGLDGAVLGRHRGVIHYTVGQRRGLGLGGGPPLYVIRLDAAARRVVVGPHEALGCGRVALREVNWIGAERPANGAPVTVRLRSTHPGAPATVVAGDGDAAEVILDTPEHGVAPGQACVVYRGERVLGGGFIARAEPARAAA